MNEADAIEIMYSAIWTIIVAGGPAVAAAMFVGIVIALLQALTQIQEMTLTFIPKIIVILLVTAATGSFMGSTIFAFANEAYGRISTGF
jgi:flagellar biosynthesis protein FliQ